VWSAAAATPRSRKRGDRIGHAAQAKVQLPAGVGDDWPRGRRINAVERCVSGMPQVMRPSEELWPLAGHIVTL
jgi:hypothetical protein